MENLKAGDIVECNYGRCCGGSPVEVVDVSFDKRGMPNFRHTITDAMQGKAGGETCKECPFFLTLTPNSQRVVLARGCCWEEGSEFTCSIPAEYARPWEPKEGGEGRNEG